MRSWKGGAAIDEQRTCSGDMEAVREEKKSNEFWYRKAGGSQSLKRSPLSPVLKDMVYVILCGVSVILKLCVYFKTLLKLAFLIVI